VEELIKIICGYIALLVEAVAALVIAYGTIEAGMESVRRVVVAWPRV
jgi:hypothetical protein